MCQCPSRHLKPFIECGRFLIVPKYSLSSSFFLVETSYFEICCLPEDAKQYREFPHTLTQLHLVIIFYINTGHGQNRESDIGTLLLTHGQILHRFQQLLSTLFSFCLLFYVYSSLKSDHKGKFAWPSLHSLYYN